MYSGMYLNLPIGAGNGPATLVYVRATQRGSKHGTRG
jgi:hypothetical protein